MTVTSPKYSLINFNELSDFGLPVMNASDLSFQVFIDDLPEGFDTSLPLSVYAVLPESIASETEFDNNKLLTTPIGTLSFGNNNVWLFVPNEDFTGMYDGDCFRLAFELNGSFFVSNNFKWIEDEIATALLKYSSDENSSGFIYCNVEFENSVRVPLLLWKPQFLDDENVYVRSDGSRKVTKSVTSKEYEGVTDYLPIWIHERIKVALSSDNVNIDCNEYSGDIVKDGNYEITYPDYIIEQLYQATFKVFASPYMVANDSCGTCE